MPRRLGQAVTEAVTLRPQETLAVVLEYIPESEMQTAIGIPLSFYDVQTNVNASLHFYVSAERSADRHLQWTTVCQFLGFPWPLRQAVSEAFPLRGITLPQTEKCPTTLKNRTSTGPLALHWKPPKPLTVMPTVYQIANGLFRRPLRVVTRDVPQIPEPEPPNADAPRFTRLARKGFATYERLNRVYENSMEIIRPGNTPHVWKVR